MCTVFLGSSTGPQLLNLFCLFFNYGELVAVDQQSWGILGVEPGVFMPLAVGSDDKDIRSQVGFPTFPNCRVDRSNSYLTSDPTEVVLQQLSGSILEILKKFSNVFKEIKTR